MTIKPDKNRKYYRKCSNNFAADCNIIILILHGKDGTPLWLSNRLHVMLGTWRWNRLTKIVRSYILGLFIDQSTGINLSSIIWVQCFIAFDFLIEAPNFLSGAQWNIYFKCNFIGNDYIITSYYAMIILFHCFRNYTKIYRLMQKSLGIFTVTIF